MSALLARQRRPTPATATCPCSTASRSKSMPARSSRSSAPTAPARRRCCQRSPGLSVRRSGTHRASAARTSQATRARRCRAEASRWCRKAGGFSRSSPFRRTSNSAAIRDRRAPRARQRMREVMEIFPVLRERREQLAGQALRRRAADVRHRPRVMSRPTLLVLDEPSVGLSPADGPAAFSRSSKATRRSEGLTIVLVEQNVSEALEVASRAYVLDHGHIVRGGSAAELRDDRPDPRNLYGIVRAVDDAARTRTREARSDLGRASRAIASIRPSLSPLPASSMPWRLNASRSALWCRACARARPIRTQAPIRACAGASRRCSRALERTGCESFPISAPPIRRSAARQISSLAGEIGCAKMRVAGIVGDDVLALKDEIEWASPMRGELLGAHAYIGVRSDRRGDRARCGCRRHRTLR